MNYTLLERLFDHNSIDKQLATTALPAVLPVIGSRNVAAGD